MEERGQALGDDQDDVVVVPFTTAERLFGEQNVLSFAMQAADPERMDRVKDEIDEIMQRRYPVKKGKAPTWRGRLQREILDLGHKGLGALTGG